jgi:hypothetical protein
LINWKNFVLLQNRKEAIDAATKKSGKRGKTPSSSQEE